MHRYAAKLRSERFTHAFRVRVERYEGRWWVVLVIHDDADEKELFMPNYPLRMTRKGKPAAALAPGDILLDFHSAPYAEVVEAPRDGAKAYPDNEHAHGFLYVTTKKIDPLGLADDADVQGIYVLDKDGTVTVGDEPLHRKPGGCSRQWFTPDGRAVILH